MPLMATLNHSLQHGFSPIQLSQQQQPQHLDPPCSSCNKLMINCISITSDGPCEHCRAGNIECKLPKMQSQSQWGSNTNSPSVTRHPTVPASPAHPLPPGGATAAPVPGPQTLQNVPGSAQAPPQLGTSSQPPPVSQTHPDYTSPLSGSSGTPAPTTPLPPLHNIINIDKINTTLDTSSTGQTEPNRLISSQADFLTVTCKEVPIESLDDITNSGLSQEEQCQLLQAMLKRCSAYVKSITGLPLNSKSHLPLQWRYVDPESMREGNIVYRLLQLGILPSETFCRDALTIFRGNFCPSNYVSEKITFEHLLEHRPTLLLLYITLGTRDNLEHMELLKYYLDEHIAYCAFVKGDLSSEIIIALAEMLYFMGYQTYLYKFHHLLRLYLASIMVVDYSLEPDCILGDNMAHKRWELRAVVGSNAMATCVGLMLPKFRTVPWSPRHMDYAKLLREQACDPVDYFLERIAAVAQMSMDVINALDSISDPSCAEGGYLSPIPKDILLNVVSPLEAAFEREAAQLRKDADAGLLHMEHVAILESLHSRSYMYLFETTMLRATPKTRKNNAFVYYLGRQIRVASEMIRRFVCYSYCSNLRLPVLISFIPLHALVSLSKAQILSHTMGGHFKVDLRGNLEILQESWTRMLDAQSSSRCLQYAFEKVVSSVEKVVENGEKMAPSEENIDDLFGDSSHGNYWVSIEDTFTYDEDPVSVYLHGLGDRALDFGERS
jgi:hypothetical protein